MTISLYELLLYSGALLILFLTPGPVWAALIARALSGGFHAAWPLALGVVIGDAFWPILAILGVSWLVSVYAEFLVLLRYAGALMLIAMGVLMIIHAGRVIEKDSRLTAPGVWAGFSAGVLINLGNPKAILFYMGILPGFFDISRVGAWDMAAIVFMSMLVPFLGNLMLAAFMHRVRALISSESSLRKVNTGSGIALIWVGVFIATS